ncbi:hypothetical protein M422DRAFT_182179 [Sphaerobolus stellatus SS14]|uniref:CHAT domain-containing protein n=1 Tax=Sphaerobolus stellatus (strain SS14) TaxID=990650 RepID=A0A0C9UYP0_SPHS4|nr:hypothetical protein M422DRAFT_182179 [Sphaerobolus stellatus SS14]
MRSYFLNPIGHGYLERYKVTQNVNDIDCAVKTYYQACQGTLWNDIIEAVYVSDYGRSFLMCYMQHGDTADLNQSVLKLQEAVQLTPDGHPDKPSRLNNLGHSLFRQFEQLGDMTDLNQSVLMFQEAVQLTPEDHPEKPSRLNNLGNSLLRRFEQLGDRTDLNQSSVLKFQEAVQLTPDGHPNKPSRLNSLGSSLFTRFKRLGDMTDLNQSILKKQEAVKLTPDGHPDKPCWLNNLGNSLLRRFERLGDMTDLNQSVLKFQEVVQLTPDGHPDKASWLNNLGNSLFRRFERLGDRTDLNQSVLKFQEAVQLTPDGHPNKPSRLNNLGSSLLRRFEQLGDMTDLNQSVLRFQEAVQLTTDGHPDKPSWLNSLGRSLLRRFERLGDMTDLNQSVLRFQEAVQLTPDGHPNKPSRLNSLGHSLLRRFERLGDMTDLNQSVLKFQEAVKLTPGGHPEKPSRLNSLGCSLLTQFERLGDITDLNQSSVLKLQEAVQLTPDGHPDKPSRLNSLGHSLLIQFERLRDITDLNKSVLKFQEAVQLTPDGHPDKPSWLNSLGSSLLSQFEQLRDMTNLNQSVLKFQEAVLLTPDGHPNKPFWLNNLGNSLFRRFGQLGDMTDLNQSVLKFREAVQLTPDGHPKKPSRLNKLGNSLFIRFLKLRLSDDMVNAVWAYSSATHAEYGPPSVRLQAAQHWAMCLQASSSPQESILDIYHIAIPLLAETAWLGSSLPDRHYQIMQAGSMVHEAAAAAHQFGDHIQAVEWLEQGRSVIWGQLLQLRTPIDDLEEKEPKLSQQLKLNSLQLEEAASPQNVILNTTPVRASIQLSALSTEEIASHGHLLAIQRKQILKEIRMCQGFERFLLPRVIGELTPAASHGPIVILNSSKVHDTCYALVLLPNLPNDVLPVKLDSFTASQAKVLYHTLQALLDNINFGADPKRKMIRDSNKGTASQGFKVILAELWEGVVRPILEALALMDPSPRVKPRLWWCPTGIFAFLPLHAAGLYHTDALPGSKLSDFAISSYIPTLSALVDRVSPLSQPGPLKLLAIAQPSSAGQQKIPGTVDEIRYIKQAVEESGALTLMTLIGEKATLENVVSGLKTATWVHFACHGVQNPAHPTESALLLAGKDRLTLARLTSLKITHGGLAFLSACQTAKGDEKLSDEAVHLSAGMLASGFGGVIATMWSVHDQVAPQVARDVYKHLKESGMDVSEAAYALHSAVENAQNNMQGEDDAAFISWVPFIHMGM